MFITALRSVRHLSLSWASPIQSIYTHPTSLRSILILSTHLCLGLPSGLWRTLVSAVMNLRVPWNAGNFLTSCKPVSFSRRILHHGVSKYYEATSPEKWNSHVCYKLIDSEQEVKLVDWCLISWNRGQYSEKPGTTLIYRATGARW